MNKSISAIILLFVLSTLSLRAAEGTGIGFITGDITGISLKTWSFAFETATDLSLSWSSSGAQGQIGLLIHTYGKFEATEGRLGFYYGPGTRFTVEDGEKSRLGLRGTAGISYFFPGAASELFLELSPILFIIPASEFAVGGGIGGRFYF